MFKLTHGSKKIEGLESIITKAKERGIDLQDFLKGLSF